jgi:tryptophanyl-tRNA synthetase
MAEQAQKPIIFSGIQPSGQMHLGVFLGALRNWVRLQETHDCIYCVVDLHAVTVRQDTASFADRCLSFVALYLAAGIDPEASTIFLQSHVSAHAELAWLLNCHAYMGELSRMTQFKEKTEGKGEKSIGVGIFDYPVLMAADILLYQTNLVPVGADQKQHLELTRDIAIRLNNLYGDLFAVPEPYIAPVAARVMSLQEPAKKMSKSDANANNVIGVLDEPDTIRKKIRKAVMDSVVGITFDAEARPGVANLLTIFGALADETPQAVAERYASSGNAALKNDLAELVVEKLAPFQARYHELMADRDYLHTVLRRGAERARERAVPTVRDVYRRMGFLVP